MQEEPINWDEDAEECAILLGERFNLPPANLLSEPAALVEATARWHIRGDGDVEALHWLSELVGYQRISASKVSALATRYVEEELLPPVERLASAYYCLPS